MEKKRILAYLFQQGSVGASTRKIASNLRIHPQHTAKLLHQLELAGECFTKGKNWCSTATALAFDPRSMTERLHEELERDLFGPEPTPKVWVFLAEFASGSKLGLSVDESFHFAQRRILESGPQGVST